MLKVKESAVTVVFNSRSLWGYVYKTKIERTKLIIELQ